MKLKCCYLTIFYQQDKKIATTYVWAILSHRQGGGNNQET